MPFKSDYLALVGVNSATYGNAHSAVSRIQGFYITARRGSLNPILANQLWTQFFLPLRPQFSTLPGTRQLYDTFATNQILALAVVLRQQNRGDFGIAQKMLNLYMKDHWAMNFFSPQSDRFLHLPLDRGLIHKLSNAPKSWSAWRTVVVTPTTQQQIISDYLQIQDSYRSYWQHVNSNTQRFASPLEMEELLWQPI